MEKEGIDGELKFFDRTHGAVIEQMMQRHLMANIAQGDFQEGRIGKEIIVTQIEVKGQILLPATSDKLETSDIIVIRVIQDTQTNEEFFVSDDYIETDAFNAFEVLANQERFITHYEEVIEFSSRAGYGLGYGYVEEPIPVTHTEKWFSEDRKWIHIRLNVNIKMNFVQTLVEDTKATTNNLYLCTWSARGLTTLTAVSRLRFKN